MKAPAKSPTFPATAINPRRIKAPTSLPAFPSTNDQSSIHSSPAAPIGAAQSMTGISSDVNLPACHFSAGPVARIAISLDLAAAHSGPQVHARIALYNQPSLVSSRPQCS